MVKLFGKINIEDFFLREHEGFDSPGRPRLRPPSALAPAPAPALAPVAEDFDPDHPFGHCDAWTIGVLRQSFNSLNDSLRHLGRPPVNAPLVPSVAGYIYVIFMVAKVIRGLP